MDRDSSDGPSEEPTLPPQEFDSGNNVKETLETEEPIQDLMEEDGNEDAVVREIDVYLSPELDSNTELYILQYPLRPNWRPYELDQRCVEVRVKPKSAKVDIDLSVDTNSKNYDTNASDRVKMTKQVLTSSPLGNPSRKNPPIAVGVLVGNKLHVNLVDAVVQLRPSMQHLNPESSRKNSAVSEVEANKPGPSNKLNKDTEEPWVPLKYHGSASEISARYRQKMLAGPDWSQMLSSMTLLLELPLEKRLKTWLVKGSAIHRFNVLKDHLAPTESEENVLRVLGKYAHLIQGLWIPRSDLLYETDQGIEKLVRDYVLLLFSKNLTISSTQLPESSITELMKEVLNVFAIERPLLGDWKFKECQDVSFMKRHPNIVEEHKCYWDLKEECITYGVFGGSGKPNSVDRPVSSKNSNNVAPKTLKAPSRAPMPSEIRDALPNALQKIFRTFKVCSFEHILSRLKEMAISEAMRPKGLQRRELMDAAGGVYFKEELLEIVYKVAIEINGVFVSKSSTDHSQSFELRRIVIDLLKAEPNAKLIEASAIKAAKMRLKRDISTFEFHKVISELCKWEDSAWKLKSGER